MGDTTDETTHEETEETTDDSTEETEESTTEDESDTSENSDDEESDDESDDDSGDDDDGEDGDGKGDSDKETDTADDDTEEFKDDGEEPELRKPKAGAPNSEWAAWRAQEKAKKEKSGESEKDDDAEDSDDDDLSDEDAAAIDKRIEKHIAPFKKAAAEQEVETEIASFLQTNPDFKPFADKVRRWANHPNRSGVPVKSIFYEVAGDKLMAIGAKRAVAANKKANKMKSSGGQNADKKGGKSYSDMSLDDFGKELEAEKLKR